MALILLVLFLVLPLTELYVIIRVGQWIGAGPTIGLLLLTGVVGAMLARSQGRGAWRRFQAALNEGRMPAGEIFDGAMVILGGALLLTPGFITDAFGILLLVPLSRAVVRGLVSAVVIRRAGMGGPVLAWGYRRARRQRPRRPGPTDAHDRAGPRPSARPYDVEGTAREVPETERELPPSADDG